MKEKYKTPDLPFDYQALEPYIDRETMQVHHDKHHVAYTNKLNVAIEKHPELFNQSAEDLLKSLGAIPKDIQTAVRNNGGGHVNHSLFWEILTPDFSPPAGKILSAIENEFGSFEKFKEIFSQAALSQFGSGWAWLTSDKGKLKVEQTANQDTPLSEGRQPILALDIWEHAYYLKYQNRRQEYIEAFWQVVNWPAVEKKFIMSKN